MSSCVVLQQPQTLKKNSISPSSSSLPYYNKNQPTSSSSSGKISPAILFIIIIIAVIFFISGVLHLLVRLLTKQRRSSSTTTTTTQQNEEVTGSFQRQLQQLFHLHDSGLDQAFIDARPVFLYRDIMGLEEPFDCAVCLSEFSHQDSLRLLPLCTHAFHVGCIDTWLLSNSTCPLCRGSLHLPIENPVFYHGEEEDYGSSGVVAASEGSAEIHKRVFSVRLGKFRSINGVGMVSKQQQQQEEEEEEEEEEEKGESSSSSCRLELDSRRCYSMGSYQYVVADSDLQVVALRPPKRQHNNNNNSLRRVVKERAGGGDSEGKKIINIGTKGDSFSVSKIWQWPRKGKSTPTTSSEQPHLPWNNNMSLNSHEPL